LLVDKNELDKKDQIKAAIATKIDTSSELYLLPVEGISGTFDLGAIDVSEEDKEALSQYTLEDNSETLSVDVYAFLQ
jgi:hypothetical protein